MFVGRENEVALLAHRLDEGRLVAVLGEAGVGKTTLVRAAVERAGKPLVEAGALATLSWLAYLPLRRAFGRDLEGDAAYVAASVEEELGDAVLFFDDLQWADTHTASLLPLLAGRVGVVVALRRGDPATASALDAVSEAGAELLPLEPLARADASALARLLHPGLSDAATHRLVERSGGNPFLLEELGSAGEPSESLRLAVAARLRTLTPAGHEAIAALALLGRPAPARLLGPGAAEVVEAGLATANGEVAIRHALLADAAGETLTEAERRGAHSRLAAILDDPGEAARHHASAGERALALEKAMRAVELASNPGERAAHLGLAAANADGVRSDALRIEAARALIDVGQYSDVLGILGVLQPTDPDTTAEVAFLRSRTHLGLVQIEDAARELAAAVAAGATDVALKIKIAAHRSRLAERDGHGDALAFAEEGVRIAETSGFVGPEVAEIYSALGYEQMRAGRPEAVETARHALDVARELNVGVLEFAIVNNLLFVLLLNGEPAAADALALEAVERARSLRLFIRERRFRAWHAGLAWHLGDPATAVAEAEAVLAEALTPLDRELVEPYWWFGMTDLGQGEAVRPQVEERVAHAPADDDGVGDALWVLAEIELAAGRPDAAERVTDSYFERFGRAAAFVGVLRGWAQFEQGLLPTELSDDPVALVEGAPVEVEALATLFHGDAIGAASLFDRAAALWDGRHVRGAVRCRWASAEALRRGDRLDESLARLLLVESEAERRALNVLLRRIRRSLRLLGEYRAVERTTTGILTGREAEVLELVADGLTNGEIARRLGLGQPTVARLISTAQQKLGAKSRAQAAALAVRR